MPRRCLSSTLTLCLTAPSSSSTATCSGRMPGATSGCCSTNLASAAGGGASSPKTGGRSRQRRGSCSSTSGFMLRAAEPWHASSHVFMLLCRARHADVMEWVLWLNTHDSFTYRYTHGDKDTFGAAFYVTDKPEQYYQV